MDLQQLLARRVGISLSKNSLGVALGMLTAGIDLHVIMEAEDHPDMFQAQS